MTLKGLAMGLIPMWMTFLQTGKNGCFSTEVPAASFNLTNFNYENWLIAKALLIEKGSGEHSCANSPR